MELGNFEQLHYGGNSACRFFLIFCILVRAVMRRFYSE